MVTSGGLSAESGSSVMTIHPVREKRTVAGEGAFVSAMKVDLGATDARYAPPGKPMA